jgi:hypothetical protein
VRGLSVGAVSAAAGTDALGVIAAAVDDYDQVYAGIRALQGERPVDPSLHDEVRDLAWRHYRELSRITVADPELQPLLSSLRDGYEVLAVRAPRTYSLQAVLAPSELDEMVSASR